MKILNFILLITKILKPYFPNDFEHFTTFYNMVFLQIYTTTLTGRLKKKLVIVKQKNKILFDCKNTVKITIF